MGKKSANPNLLLINPWIYDFAAYNLWMKPIGLLSLASFLRNNKFNIYMIDCLDMNSALLPDNIKVKLNKSFGTSKYIKTLLNNPKALAGIPRRYGRYGISIDIFKKLLTTIPYPDAVLVTSMMTYWYPGVSLAIEIIKEKFPGIQVFLGGIYASICSEHAEKYSGADVIVTGKTYQEIVHLLNGDKQSSIKDDNFGNQPYPAFDLYQHLDFISLLTSKGCPYNCSYCVSSQINKQFVLRDPVSVVDEIEYWQKRYKVNDFAFYDDALLFNPKNHIIPLLEEVIKRNIKCNFHAPNGLHVKDLSYELAQLMLKGGFKTLRFGLETSNRERQMTTGGKVTNEDFKEAIKNLRNAGYSENEIGVYILAGLPQQDHREVLESIHFVWKTGAKPIITEYSPIPSTPLWNEAVKNSKYDLAVDPLFHNNSIFPCECEKFTRDDLNRLKIMIKDRYKR